MAQGYYTLDEAAHILGLSADELKMIARRGEIRSFQDRGTWRFRQQDIQEMARQRGLGSDPDLVLGDALAGKAKDAGAPKSGILKKEASAKSGLAKDAGTPKSAVAKPPAVASKSGVAKPGEAPKSAVAKPGDVPKSSVAPEAGPVKTRVAKDAAPKGGPIKPEVVPPKSAVAKPGDAAKSAVAKPADAAKSAVAKPGDVAKSSVAKPADVAKSSVAKPADVPKSSVAKPGDAPKSSVAPEAGPVKTRVAKDAAPKSPVAKRVSQVKPAPEPQPEVLDFSLAADDEATDVGREKPGKSARGGKPPSSGKKQSGLVPDAAGQSGLGKSPTPEPGSDSDVRLVGQDAAANFNLTVDSGVRLDEPPHPMPGSQLRKTIAKPDSGKRRPPPPEPTSPDSGVRLVPLESDSDVRLSGSDTDDKVPLGEKSDPSASDSDIRLDLDLAGPPADAEAGSLTEEIDLDEEIRKQEQKEVRKTIAAKVRPKPPDPAESTSPFELSDDELKLPSTGSTMEIPMDDSGSSDFELIPSGDSSSPLDETGSSEFELSVPAEDDVVDLEPDPKATHMASAGGLSLDKPIDSGISLEQESEGSDEIPFTLQPEDAGQPAPASSSDEEGSSDFELSLDDDSSSDEHSALKDDSSSSEFELTLDASDSMEHSALAESGSSEFELTLDGEGSSDLSSSEFELTISADEPPDLSSDSEFELKLEDAALDSSSSEFELTIDDDMGLVDDSNSGMHPVLDSSDEMLEVSTFEDEDSGSAVVALDTDLEDSGFDMALDMDDVPVEDESSSQVVLMEEDDGVQMDVGPDYGVSSFPGVEMEAIPEEEFGAVAQMEPPEPVVVIREAAPWGVMPVLVMLPCVVVCLLVGLMSFELLQSMNGYHEPGLLTKALGGLTKDLIK